MPFSNDGQLQSVPLIFDGSDQSLSFTEFLRWVAWSPDWIALIVSIGHSNMEDLVPSRLYGEALRYYEGLDVECQQDSKQLLDALVWRFPGTTRSGGVSRTTQCYRNGAAWLKFSCTDQVIQRSPTQQDQTGLPTWPEVPPMSPSRMALPPSGIIYEEGEPDAKTAGKRTSKYLTNLRNTFRVSSLTLGRKSSIPVRSGPALTIHCLIIERVNGGTNWNPTSTTRITTLDLSDGTTGVGAAKKPPSAIFPANQAVNYWVGFVYTVHCGEVNIDFCHDVLAPSKSRIMYSRGLGKRLASPVGMATETFPISDFLSKGSWQRNRVSPGTYVIKSSIRLWQSTPHYQREREQFGVVTWKVQLL